MSFIRKRSRSVSASPRTRKRSCTVASSALRPCAVLSRASSKRSCVSASLILATGPHPCNYTNKGHFTGPIVNDFAHRERVFVFSPSILRRAAGAFALALMALGGEAALLGGPRRPRLAPRLGHGRRAGEQGDQPVERIAAVLLLRAKALRLDDDDSVLGHAAAGQP